MKMKKFLVGLLVVCMVFGCMSMTAFAQETETITVGESKTVTVKASDGAELDEYVSYHFTPEQSGTYFLSVSYDESQSMNCGAWLYAGEAYFSFGEPLQFEAVAGETCVLKLNYFGTFKTDVDYVVSLNQVQPLEGIELSAEATSGYVGDYLYIDVTYQPEFGEREELTWTVSDNAVVEIQEAYSDYAELALLSAGTVTVTAATVGGKTASIEITVEDVPGAAVYTVGANKVSISNGDSQLFTFTPEKSGYYTLSVDHSDAGCGLDADSVYDGTCDYYVLEAGETYMGEAYLWFDEEGEFSLSIEYYEGLKFPVPVAIEIVKLPSNITYLKGTIQDIWSDDLLSGMELKVTWDDGTVSDWSYDENDGYLGIYRVGGFLNEKEDGGYEVEVYVAFTEEDVETAFFDLNVLDVVPKSIELVDQTPLQIVENSCGIALEEFDAWFYLPLTAFERQVKITFSDGSVVTAKPGDDVYGLSVECVNNQGGVIMNEQTRTDGFWSKDSQNLVIYSYGELNVTLDVQIIDSPVESIELVTAPVNDTFVIDEDGNIMTKDGQVMEDFRLLLDGISLKVNYKDGSSKTFTSEDIEWVDVMGEEYPFIEGYPMGVLGEWLLSMEQPVPPCELEGYVEYKGVAVTYPISIVEKFPAEDGTDGDQDETDKPVIEPIPGTGDADLVMGMIMLTCLLGTAAVITGKKKYF